MNRSRLLCIAAGLVVAFTFFSCQQKQKTTEKKIHRPDIISAYTTGIISRESPIRIQFTDDIMTDSLKFNAPIADNPFEFKPGIKGVAVWVDARNLEFRPSERLPQNTRYKVSLVMNKVSSTPGMQPRFDFQFASMTQSFEISIDGLQSLSGTDLRFQRITGTVVTADVEYNPDIEKILSASQRKRQLNIQWTHSEDRLTHSFVIDTVQRGDDSSEVTVGWDGAPVKVNKKDKMSLGVPSLSSFTATQVRSIQGEEHYIEIRFSDPLQKNQNLDGLITVSGKNDCRFTIEDNILKIYSQSGWRGTVDVTVHEGIRNIMGRGLKRRLVQTVVFEESKPQVRFAGKGVILPRTQGLTIPIEAVNLRAVRVTATRIFEKNMPQFLQVNDLAGNSELRRVGTVVWKKSVPLDLTSDKENKWIRYGLDVSQLIADNPGGLYKIELSFKKADAVYNCSDSTNADSEETENEQVIDGEQETSYWDGSEEYDGDYSNWEENYNNRENPCHPAYYKQIGEHDIRVSRNVLVSDIGLIAKRGTGGTVHVFATDIRTAEPLAGVSLKLLSFPQQELATGKTDNLGMATFTTDKEPFLIVAQNETQYGYLKLDNGSALSVSHFDVAGEKIVKGLKGFLYGERGVWRPGDTLFLTFILMDTKKKLPAEHPVTFELRNARGQLVKTVKRTQSLNGFYSFVTATNPDDPTGDWNAKVKVGGAVFEKTLKIETVMPNRLKIKIDFGKPALYSTDKSIEGTLSAMWLHGAIARNLHAVVDVTLAKTSTQFPAYSEYCFDDPVKTYEPETQSLFEGDLDENGTTKVKGRIETTGNAPGMLMANFRTRVFEPGGAASVDRFSIPYHPYKQYIGIRVPKGDKARGMLLTDTTHFVKISAISPDGKPVTTRVAVKLYKVQWRWWWEQGPESMAEYLTSSEYRPLKTDTVDVVNGTADWNLRLAYPEWGRYLIRAFDLNGKHSAGKVVYIDWPGWAGRQQKDIPGGATVLTFSTDKAEYTTGENVTVTIPTPQKGRGLVSIETGTRVIKSDWITAGEKETRYEFKATPEMAPTVYVHVTFLQPHLQAVNDLPIRLYGVIPVKITDPQTHVKPVIECSDVFEPSGKAKITVKEQSNRPFTYTLAIVDEGLLDLTRFQTPEPWDEFYKREALGVKTWDLYDMVIGAFGGQLEKMLSIGGDEEAADKAKKRANRFPPMVRFAGPFELKGGKATHEIDIPQYVGSVRVMVVAGQDGAFGCAEKQVFVRKPLMILGTLPRVLGPEETVSLPVAVFVLEKTVKNVNVSLSVKGPVAVEGESSKKMSFSQPGDEIVPFSIKAENRTGVAEVTMKAEGAGQKAVQTIEIDVRHPGWPVTNVEEDVIDGNKEWKTKAEMPGAAGTNTALLEVSRIPPLNLGKRLNYLIQYPHGCVEQTTSSVFPQLYLDKLLDISPDWRKQIETNVKAGIEHLKTFQVSDGGFGYWPGAGSSDEWASNYAGNFLVEAQKAGYLVPSGMLDQWKKYERTRALSWTSTMERSQLMQAYRLYVLALAGAPELSAMNRMREIDKLEDASKWQLAAAYQLAGQPDAARDIVKDGRIAIPKYRELWYTYGSDVRDKALVLEALSLMGMREKAKPLALELSKELCNDEWMSTQSTAYALIALVRHAGISVASGDMQFTYAWMNGKETAVKSSKPVVQIKLACGSATEGEIKVKNTGSGTVYPRLISEGIPAPGSETAAVNGMSIDVGYKTLKGDDIKPENLEQGTDFIAEIKVKNTGTIDYKQIALSHLVASGWEIHNDRLDPDQRAKESPYQYRDIRDDRVYTYFDLNRAQERTFRVLLNASYLGKFYMPMIGVEAMYDATINARMKGEWVSVVQPGE